MKLNLLSPDEFQDLCGQIFSVEIPDFEAPNKRKDKGIDGYVHNKIVYAVYSPEDNSSKKHKAKIRSDLGKLSSLINSKEIQITKWIFVTPENIPADALLYAHQECEKLGLISECWGSSKLIPLIRVHPEIKDYFPKLIEFETQSKLNEMHQMLVSLSQNTPQLILPSEELNDSESASKANTQENTKVTETFRFWNEGKLEQALQISKDTYFSTSVSVKLQSIINILLLSKDDSHQLDYLISLANEGILLSISTSARSTLCAIKARKANLLAHKNYIISIRLLENYFYKEALGFGLLAAEESEYLMRALSLNSEEMDELFTSGISEAQRLNDSRVLAFIKMTQGMTLALAYLNMLNMPFASTNEQLGTLKQSTLECYSDSRRLYSSINDISGEAFVLHNLAATLLMLGEYDLAEQYSEESVSLSKSINDTSTLGSSAYLKEAIAKVKSN